MATCTAGLCCPCLPPLTCNLSMATVDPNASVKQCVPGDGGAGNLSAALNAIGRWGTVLTSTVTGKPVVYNRAGSPIGAPGSGVRMNGNTLLLLFLIVAVLLFVATRK